MYNPFQSPVILSLCPGSCGLERGIERAIGKIHVAAFVEIETFICENLVQQMESGVLDSTPIFTNVNLSLGFAEVLKSLLRMGYSVETGVFSAEEVGAPHERMRLFILAINVPYAECLRSEARAKRSGWKEGSNTNRRSEKSELGNSASERLKRFTADIRSSIEEERNPEQRSGTNGSDSTNELADANSMGTGGINPELPTESGQVKGKTWKRKRGGDESKNSSEGVAHTDSSGFQIDRNKSEPIEPGNDRTSDTSTDRWPAGRGEEQYDWEAPRLESRLGFTVNGYNFREDLLRMAGNAVLEQVAEKAFTVILNKFKK